MTIYDGRPTLEITSVGNPRVKWLTELRKRRVREAEQVTIVEGHDELLLALEAGVVPREIYYSPELVRDALPIDALERVRARGAQLVELSEAPFRKASYRESPDGWLAVVDNPARPLKHIPLSHRPLVLVCESIEKPGNLGAMLRTAEAVGADAVVAAAPVTDWGNPNVIRASKGTVFVVPVAAAPAHEVIAWLGEKGVQIVVATPDAPDLITGTDLTGPVAVVVGAEHAGVSDAWSPVADHTARLPMFGHINSLNVSNSAAVILYEAVRQRGGPR